MNQNLWLLDQVARERQQELRHESDQIRMAKAAQSAQRVEARSQRPRVAGMRVLKQAMMILAAIVTTMLG
jgi:hypothetical protein